MKVSEAIKTLSSMPMEADLYFFQHLGEKVLNDGYVVPHQFIEEICESNFVYMEKDWKALAREGLELFDDEELDDIEF
jgi:hypothetical protein